MAQSVTLSVWRPKKLDLPSYNGENREEDYDLTPTHQTSKDYEYKSINKTTSDQLSKRCVCHHTSCTQHISTPSDLSVTMCHAESASHHLSLARDVARDMKTSTPSTSSEGHHYQPIVPSPVVQTPCAISRTVDASTMTNDSEVSSVAHPCVTSQPSSGSSIPTWSTITAICNRQVIQQN